MHVNLGFTFTARKENRDDLGGSYVLRDLGDQDAIHQHKKMINPLDHASRIMMFGNCLMIHMNHLLKVYEQFPKFTHGLTKVHLERKDRQNWKIAQELTFTKVQDCLKNMINNGDDSVKGTLVYLQLVWHYVEIFFSPVASLQERIKYAGFVVTFLGIWKNFVHMHQEREIGINFITRECYKDCLISCHFAVMMICYMRDCFPDVECRLDLTGSDPCESFFSLNGQWIGNHHNYSILEMERNINHMVRLQQIQADPNAPSFAKAHVKQENVWHKQFNNFVSPNLREYPQDGEEITAWVEGIQMAQEKARYVGMIPTTFNDNDDPDDPDDPSQKWFYKPFVIEDDSEMLMRSEDADEMDMQQGVTTETGEEPYDESEQLFGNFRTTSYGGMTPRIV